MKKIFLSLAVAALVSTTPLVAQNHTCGIDIASGIVAFDSAKGTLDGVECSFKGLSFFPLKISSYDCFLLGNHIGVYGSLGLRPGITYDREAKANGVTLSAGSNFRFGLDLMVGPAFGVDLGDSSVRFQIGVPFHALWAWGPDYETEINYVTKTNKYRYSAYGFALTPQFRFTANRRCSFIAGADFMFDFAVNWWQNYNGVKTSGSFDDAFSFTVLPYIGLGINFGD